MRARASPCGNEDTAFPEQRAATGCGDAATAGWIWALQDRCSPDETLRRAIACGTAKLASADPGSLSRALVQKYVIKISVYR